MSTEKKKVRRLELAGQVYGRLTVKDRAGVDRHERVLWHCVCECGADAVVAGKSLVTGMTRSCGCLRRDLAPLKSQPNKRCFPGAKFGLLTVVEAGGEIWGRPAWRCACECGGERVVSSSSLRKGNAKSCGCIGIKRGRKPKAAKPAAKPVAQPLPRAATPKVTRMSIKPEMRTADGSAKAAPRKADKRPAWRPQSEYKPATAPAQRVVNATICPAPKFNHRYGVDPSEVTPLFSAMRPGQYLEVSA